MSPRKSNSDMCRICCTKTDNMVTFSEMLLECPDITILNALEVVLQHDFHLEKLKTICSICSNFLEIAYKLVVQFQETTKKLELVSSKKSIRKVSKKVQKPKKAKSSITVIKTKLEEISIKNETIQLVSEPDIKQLIEQDPKTMGFYDNVSNLNSPGSVLDNNTNIDNDDDDDDDCFLSQLKKENMIDIEESQLIIKSETESSTISNKTEPKLKTSDEKTEKIVKPRKKRQKKIKEEDEVLKEMKRKKIKKYYTQKEKIPGVTYTCDSCQNVYTSKGFYLKHLQICIETDSYTTPIILCHHCQSIVYTQKELTDHIRSMHPNEKGDLFCPKCDAVFRTQSTYYYHLSTHEGRKFLCEKCDKFFSTKYALKTHLDTHDPNKRRHLCNICGKSFHYDTALRNHVRGHNNDKRFVCKYCNKKFLILTNLKDHVRIHTGIKPFACSFCDKKFSRQSIQKKHEMLHTGDKPFHCQFCGRGWTTKYHHNRHLLSHPGPFSCELCDGTFMEMDILKFHVNYKHKDRAEARGEFSERKILLSNVS